MINFPFMVAAVSNRHAKQSTAARTLAWRLKTAATFLLAVSPLQAGLSREAFRNPPLQARPSALWSWLNGYVDHMQITRELEEMKANGMRGALIWDLGRLTWKVPAGAWRILRFVRNNTGEFLNCPSPNSKGLVIDHLSREATDAYMTHILDKLKSGRTGYGPLTVLMLDSYEVRPGIDWTPDFIKEFKARNDYDPTPCAPVSTK